MKCEIQWIDWQGKPTPDANEAIGYAWVEAHTLTIDGRLIHTPESKHFPICAKHAKRLPMPHWRFDAKGEEEEK